MVRNNVRWAGLILLFSLLRFGPVASAQDCDDTLACDSAAEPDAALSDFFEHSGLLGKPYIDVRYLHLEEDSNDLLSSLDSSIQGVIITGNEPLTALDALPGPFHFDLFTEFTLVTLAGGGDLGPDFDNLHGELDVELTTFGVGLTSFAEVFGRVRPYIQLGYIYERVTGALTIAPLVFPVTESDSDLLLNVGTEVDITRWLAARVELDFNNVSRAGGPVAIAELICQPIRRVYLRGGVFAPFEGDGVGGTIGAGVVF